MQNTGIPATLSIRKTTILTATQWCKRKRWGVVSEELTKHPLNSEFCGLHPLIHTLLGFAPAQDIESGKKAELLAEPVRRRRIRLQRAGHHFKFPLKRSLSQYIRIAVSLSPPMGKAAGRVVIYYNLDMSLLMARTSLY